MAHCVRLSMVSILLSLGVVAPPAPTAAESLSTALGGEILPEWQFEEARQYDFWIGEWRANWREREEGEFFNANSSGWAQHWLFPVLDGKALIEIVRSEKPDEHGAYTQGFSLRYYDPVKKRWVMAQNWPAPNTSHAFLDQLQGSSHHGRIQVFSGLLNSEGNALVRRYTFSDIAPERFRWDSATTTDSGITWRAGTIAEFHRAAITAPLPEVGTSLPDSPDGTHCNDAGFKYFDFLEGRWEGEAGLSEQEPLPARLVATRFQNGCSVLSVLEYPQGEADYKLLQAWTYGTKSQKWFSFQLDNQLGSAHEYRLGTADEDGRLVLNANPDLTIADDFSPPAWVNGVVPETPLARTVWTRMEPDQIAFEFQRRSGTGDWMAVASFRLEKRSD